MRDISLKIVRQTFETYVSKGELFHIPYSLPNELNKAENGVFVAAFEKIGARPRGRVGTISPSKSTLAEEIQTHTISLANSFAFRKQDLPLLVYELLIIRTPHLLPDLNDLQSNEGLLIRTDAGKTAFSLPSFKKKTPQIRLNEIYAKETIDRNVFSVRLYRFNIDRFSEQNV